MKYASPRPYADPEKAARRLIEIASTIEPIQEGRIHIEKVNGPFLFQDQARPEEYAAGIVMAVERGWLLMQESGTLCGLLRLELNCSHESRTKEAAD
jgi:hypothetical protein